MAVLYQPRGWNEQNPTWQFICCQGSYDGSVDVPDLHQTIGGTACKYSALERTPLGIQDAAGSTLQGQQAVRLQWLNALSLKQAFLGSIACMMSPEESQDDVAGMQALMQDQTSK